MVDMQEVRRVLCPQVMCNRREESRGFITGRLHDLAMKAGKGLCHQDMPGVLIACSCRVLSHHRVAHGFSPYQAEPPGTRFILRHGEVFRWQCARAARTLLLAGGHDGLLHTTVDLV